MLFLAIQVDEHGRKSGGGGGRGDVSPPPPTFFQVGNTISNVPPRFGSRMNFGRYNVFFFCLSEMFVMWVGYPYTF